MSRNGFGLLSIDWGLGPSAEQVLAKARELVAAGTNAVQNELERLRKLQEEPKTLAAVRQAPKLRRLPPVATLQLADGKKNSGAPGEIRTPDLLLRRTRRTINQRFSAACTQ
jgi:hypothetical protein